MEKIINVNAWSVWEQPASPMLTVLVHNAVFSHSRGYLGTPIENIMCIFGPDKSGSYQGKEIFRYDEFRVLGQRMIDMFMCPQYLAAFNNDVITNEQRVVKCANEILNSNYSINDVPGVFDELEKLYNDYLGVGWVVEPMQFQTEYILSNYLKDPDKVKILSTIKEDSYSIDIIKSLRDCKAGIITPEKHSKKYHWCQNNYYETKYLSAADVTCEIKEHSIEYYDNLIRTTQQSKQELLDQKEKIMAVLPGYYQKIVTFANNIGAKFIDDRKKIIMLCNAAFDKLLAVVAKGTKTPIADVRLLIPQELRCFISNPKAYKQRFEERRKLFICIQSPFPLIDELIEPTGRITSMKDPFTAEGEAAEKILAQLDTRLNLFTIVSGHNDKLQGVVAYHNENEIIGIVRIIKNPIKEKLIAGEILVATTTTPDYLDAICKSLAIVTDYGGQTSHAAIVTRELKKPCIIGTNCASQVLQTGQKVKINFVDGTVEVIK